MRFRRGRPAARALLSERSLLGHHRDVDSPARIRSATAKHPGNDGEAIRGKRARVKASRIADPAGQKFAIGLIRSVKIDYFTERESALALPGRQADISCLDGGAAAAGTGKGEAERADYSLAVSSSGAVRDRPAP